MAEDFKHVEQTCLELLKMVDAISLAIEQLRQQQSDKTDGGDAVETFADCYSRKMLEDNEINMLKFLGRYLCEKDKLSSSKDNSIPSAISGFPSFGQWLKIIGVVDLVITNNSDSLAMPLEDVLKAGSNEPLTKLCASSSFKSDASRLLFSKTVIKATDNLRYYMNCLRSGTFCDSEKLSWSHVEPDANNLNLGITNSPSPSARFHFSVGKSSSAGRPPINSSVFAQDKNKTLWNETTEQTVLMSKLGVTPMVLSPLQSSASLRPRLSAVAAPDQNAAADRMSIHRPARDSVVASTSPSDAEEQLALRTWKDIDGVGRRMSNSRKRKSRGGLWAKFMTWSARRHFRDNADLPERTPSLSRDRGNRSAPRRLKSDPGKGNEITPMSPATLVAKSRSQASPAPTCMIHVFTTHRVFVAKCDHCQRPMAFSCLICPLCKLRVHSSCANNLPRIALSSFKPVNNSFNKKRLSQSIPDTMARRPIESNSSPPSVSTLPLVTVQHSIPRATTVDEQVPAIDDTESSAEIAVAMSSPEFPGGADNYKETDNAYSPRRKDSTDSVGIVMYPRRSTIEHDKSLNIHIPTVPEEEVTSPISSPSYNNYSASFSAKTSHIDSTGSSGTGDLRYDFQMTSPSPFFSGTAASTPASYHDKRQIGRRPTRMSTFSEWSVTLKEWLIPFTEVTTEAQPIARGRYTTVYRGIWHGDVAVKVFHGLDDEEEEGSKAAFFSSEQLVRTFKDEVSILPHTRHENLVLFLGASIDREQLVIMSTFCKGRTLDSLIYPNGICTANGNGSISRAGGSLHHSVTSPQANLDQFSAHLITADSILYTATQIAQAVAYLHNKGILHKDLRLRNIFIEANGRILLSDYGIFNATRLATNRHPDFLFVSRSWLFCLAPELARALTISPVTFASPDMGLPFSEHSDVFSFGCVWFELIFRKPPVQDAREDCHVLIYERGQVRMPEATQCVIGLPMDNARDLLMKCWAKEPTDRLRFSDIIDSLAQISPLVATAAAAGIAGGGMTSAGNHNRNRAHLGASHHRFAHHPVRSPSQPLRGGSSRSTRALPFAIEPLSVEDSRK